MGPEGGGYRKRAAEKLLSAVPSVCATHTQFCAMGMEPPFRCLTQRGYPPSRPWPCRPSMLCRCAAAGGAVLWRRLEAVEAVKAEAEAAQQAALAEAALRAKAAIDKLAALQADYDNFK